MKGTAQLSKRKLYLLVLLLMPLFCLGQADPPFGGTIFIDPDIINSTDSSTFLSISYTGQGSRRMYDRRVNTWITVNAYLFNCSFSDGLSAEIQVNPEFNSSDAAQIEAEKYAWVIGQLPTGLRKDVETVWIHKGVNPFGGGNNNLLIHTGQAKLYEQDGILAETFVHEAAHTSLDRTHASANAWIAAQAADRNFISSYARDNPTREDIAESFLPYLAVRYRSDRISQSLKETIEETMPNRIEYFDNQSIDMFPILISTSKKEYPVTLNSSLLNQNYPNPFYPSTEISYSIPEYDFVNLRVYNAFGKEIQVLVSEFQNADTYSIYYSADNLSSGIYFYKLNVGNEFVETRRMWLIR